MHGALLGAVSVPVPRGGRVRGRPRWVNRGFDRRLAIVGITPGMEIPTDVRVLSAYGSMEYGRAYVLLTGEWLPWCIHGLEPVGFSSMRELVWTQWPT